MKKSGLKLSAAFNVLGLSSEVAGTALLVPYVIHKLGVDTYGLITSIISIAVISQMLAQSALVVAIRQVATLWGGHGGRVRLLDEIRITRVSLAILAGLAVLGIAGIQVFRDELLAWLGVTGALNISAHRALALLCVLLPGMLLGSLFPAILRGRERFGMANGIKAVSVFIRVASVFVVFESWGASLLAFVAIRCGTVVLEGLIAAFATSRGQGTMPRVEVSTIAGDTWDSALRQSGVLLAYALGNLVVLEVSKSVVGGIFDLRALGVFGAASAAASLVARLGQAISSVFTPAVSSLDGGGDRSRSASLVRRGAIWTAVLVSVVALSSIPAWRLIAPLWLGKELGGEWAVVAAAFAGQGVVSAVSPAVFSAYGRGKVAGVSFIHLGVNALSLALAVIAREQLGLGLLGFVMVLACVRGVGACANFYYAAWFVFELRDRGVYVAVLGTLFVAAFCGTTAGFLMQALGGSLFVDGLVAVFSVLGIGLMGWRTIKSTTSGLKRTVPTA